MYGNSDQSNTKRNIQPVNTGEDSQPVQENHVNKGHSDGV